ncbi:hypothetical protein K503DRAFT_635846 [Rhizopogon vinicolor AM-OR11-026]|uniref:DUF6533 domain-containing protein n=1 Tax=Rhizopogon vinicolor AM-OR11-026 TaxID=1314800 RepID=A0A1B7N5W2_9AGAM|nr:hypothetical protein K503DRAFT_635846 [Rhizopogon vinicolor AM-OR11-026]
MVIRAQISPLTVYFLNMTMVSDDPSWRPVINFYRIYSYVTVASSTAFMYDWALTFGQEIELVWKQRWSLMTVLYLSVRYVGILFSIATMLTACLPSVSVTHVVSNVMVFAPMWTSFVVNTMLRVIMLFRLHAMYQQSRQMFIFLVVVFLMLTIACGVIAAIKSHLLHGDEFILSGTYQCVDGGNVQLLTAETWIFGTVWEVTALCLAVWIAVKHFRELQRPSTGSVIGDCFTVLIKTHVFYSASYAAVSCFSLGLLSRKISVRQSVTDICI